MTRKKVLNGEEPRRRVAICGTAETTIHLMPWDDESLEVWGLAWRELPRADRLFDMHHIGPHRARVQMDYEARLASLAPTPVYLIHDHKDIPNAVRYPIEDVRRLLGSDLDPFAKGSYFASSVSYMIALAIYEQVHEIHLYGLDFITSEEYLYQKPNMEYLIGIARGRGIHVMVAEGSALCEFHHVYGYERWPSGFITRDMLMERLQEYEKKREEGRSLLQTADGAYQETKQLIEAIEHQERGGFIRLRSTRDRMERETEVKKDEQRLKRLIREAVLEINEEGKDANANPDS